MKCIGDLEEGDKAWIWYDSDKKIYEVIVGETISLEELWKEEPLEPSWIVENPGINNDIFFCDPKIYEMFFGSGGW